MENFQYIENYTGGPKVFMNQVFSMGLMTLHHVLKENDMYQKTPNKHLPIYLQRVPRRLLGEFLTPMAIKT
jgi:hypothetical protein